ncbi:outer membrane assembly protein BamE [Pseudoalteromonas rubra]|uniref:Outer membrane protein assembly factor BamE n=1 Tax=Pseudoalteromonas rubra TaxID=43658 RepID=A0A5S3WLK3_9GAMM|nr:outer membrane assembly protein BamE [Pseudoalteromonas rubra]TMP36940.1 outer membrane assembly protein BamE [Pseudoalteromonas rubra]
MQLKKRLFVWLTIILATTMLSACSSWVYRINIPQGNFLEQSDVDKLRIAMTKEQVLYVLGTPVAKDAFNTEIWHYSYVFNLGRDSEQRRELVVYFKGDNLSDISGDFDKPADFNTPLSE